MIIAQESEISLEQWNLPMIEKKFGLIEFPSKSIRARPFPFRESIYDMIELRGQEESGKQSVGLPDNRRALLRFKICKEDSGVKLKVWVIGILEIMIIVLKRISNRHVISYGGRLRYRERFLLRLARMVTRWWKNLVFPSPSLSHLNFGKGPPFWLSGLVRAIALLIREFMVISLELARLGRLHDLLAMNQLPGVI